MKTTYYEYDEEGYIILPDPEDESDWYDWIDDPDGLLGP